MLHRLQVGEDDVQWSSNGLGRVWGCGWHCSRVFLLFPMTLYPQTHCKAGFKLSHVTEPGKSRVLRCIGPG